MEFVGVRRGSSGPNLLRENVVAHLTWKQIFTIPTLKPCLHLPFAIKLFTAWLPPIASNERLPKRCHTAPAAQTVRPAVKRPSR